MNNLRLSEVIEKIKMKESCGDCVLEKYDAKPLLLEPDGEVKAIVVTESPPTGKKNLAELNRNSIQDKAISMIPKPTSTLNMMQKLRLTMFIFSPEPVSLFFEDSNANRYKK